MQREPLGLYILRVALGIGTLLLIAMLYWSSLLIEQDVKTLQSHIEKIEGNLQTLHTGISHIRSTGTYNSASIRDTEPLMTTKRPHIDPTLPNLLQNDPFYAVTLPKMLEPNFQPHGTFQSDVLGKPNNLNPFNPWANVSTWLSLCGVSLSRLEFGKYETFAPDMAIKIEERRQPNTGAVEFWVHLRDGVYWEPLQQDLLPSSVVLAPHFLHKHQVTAADFKFFFDAMMNPYIQEGRAVALRTYYEDMQDLEVVDPLTFIVRWKGEKLLQTDGTESVKTKYIAKQLTGGLNPLPCFVYQYFADGTKIVLDDTDPTTYRTSSTWAQNFAHHWANNIIVSCGAWIFDGMTERQIRFKRNPNHYFPYDALADGWEFYFKDTPDALWQDFKANKLDSYEIRPDQLLELTHFLDSEEYRKQLQQPGSEILRLEYVARVYAYIAWNEARPYFTSKKVRQALTMAIDRQRIIRQNLNGLGIEITGTFYRFSPAYDLSIEPWPFDPLAAKRLLESEGWYDSDGDGILDKTIDGKQVPFRFSLTYYVKNPTSKAICEYIATALKEIGIACELNGVDIADLTAVFEDKNFDALNLAWALGTPPEDPKQLWDSSGAKQKGSSNAIGFANPEIDKIIHELQFESDPSKRTALYHRFDAILHEEAPYAFLYTPKTLMLYRERLQNVFIPAQKQELIPGANIGEPQSTIFWLK
jgi:peptide/nickel transport system substrate-binding protein